MSYILNIGLPSFYEGTEIDAILAAASASGLTVQRFEIQGPRMVAEASANGCFTPIEPCINRLAKKLGRDCIAVYYPGLSTGQLIGPKAAAWGEFDVYKFRFPQEVAA